MPRRQDLNSVLVIGSGAREHALLLALAANEDSAAGRLLALTDAAIAAGMPRGTGAGDARALWRRHGSAGVAALMAERDAKLPPADDERTRA